MRLIDADAVDIEHWNYSIVDEGCYEETQAMFDAEPTVEAIPIEWLKQFVYTIPDVIEHLIVLWRREQEQSDEIN